MILGSGPLAFGSQPQESGVSAPSWSWYGTPIWAGYVQQGSGITEVQADWTVPPQPSAIKKTTASASEWIGIGGANDNPIVQEGTDWVSIGGAKPELTAWYEFIDPKTHCCDLVPIPLKGLAANNHIVSVLFEDSPTEWHLALFDETTDSELNVIANSCR